MELRNYTEDRNIIEEVKKGSIAEELEIEVGDILLSINGRKVKDIIDYKYLISDEYLEIAIKKKNGEVWHYEIEKDYDEDLGLVFTNPLIDKAKSCRNKCIFCFIDQLPPNMRETLYFKDDDSRLSFLQGNFITLTNMNDEEIQRIIDYRLSPINVSVHTTNPELRIRMLNNKNAGKIYDILKRFSEANLVINCQIVLVPEINDGAELERTLNDLSKLHPSINSVAVVPVGITKYRENLPRIRPFTVKEANELLNYIFEKQKAFINSLGTRFVFASDEFFALTNRPIPSYQEYEGFPQLENGVGLMRLFEDEVVDELRKIKTPIIRDRKFIIATGTIAYNFMCKIRDLIYEKFKGLELKVVPIKNNFFGETITVSGLITGKDLIEQLMEYKNYDKIIIPRSMLKHDENIFLDDLTLDDVSNALNIEIIPCKVKGKNIINIIRNR